MHQRSGAIHHAQYTRLTDEDFEDGHRHVGIAETSALLNVMENVAATPAPNRGGGFGRTKKLLLWLVLVLQICFIGFFWLLQLGFSASVIGGSTTNTLSVATTGGRGLAIVETDGSGRGNFIRKAAEAAAALKLQIKIPKVEAKVGKHLGNLNLEENVNNFVKDFYIKTNRLNRTGGDGGGESEMAPLEESPQIWCFRAGTRNETSLKSQTELEAEAELLLWEPEERCTCESDWHGRDCGQPELMWRAIMMSRRPFVLQKPRKDRTHRLVHMLEGNFYSLDMLELQIQAVVEVVDYFIIYKRNVESKFRDLKALERRLREKLSRGNYFVFHCGGGGGSSKVTENCTAADAYRRFRKTITGSVYQPTDLFLYTNDREILAPYALTFLKYYATDVRLMRFRMKYNVYGFYWQHPLRTRLTGVISSLVHLDSPQLGNADPAQLLRQAAESTSSPALIIGDLNHVGGWYCKYCLQPDEIIDELNAESSLSVVIDLKSSQQRDVQFPNSTRTHHIDAAYLRTLIATGIYVDGRTTLTKLRRYSDRYYAPAAAEANSWKFGNLLVNLYESLEEDIEDEEIAVY